MTPTVLSAAIQEILQKDVITEADGYMLGACVVVLAEDTKLSTREAILDVMESFSQELCIKCGMEVGAGSETCQVCGPYKQLKRAVYEAKQDELDVVEPPEKVEATPRKIEMVAPEDLIVCNQCGQKVPDTVGCMYCGKDPRAPKVVEAPEPKAPEVQETPLETSPQVERLEAKAYDFCYICEEGDVHDQEDGSLVCSRCKSEWDNREEFDQEKSKQTQLDDVDPDQEAPAEATEQLEDVEEPIDMAKVMSYEDVSEIAEKILGKAGLHYDLTEKGREELQKLYDQIHEVYPHHFKDGKVKKGKLKVHLRTVNDMIKESEDPFYGIAKIHLEEHQKYVAKPADLHEAEPSEIPGRESIKVPEPEEVEPIGPIGENIEQPAAEWDSEDLEKLRKNKHMSPKALSFILDKPVPEIEQQLEALE